MKDKIFEDMKDKIFEEDIDICRSTVHMHRCRPGLRVDNDLKAVCHPLVDLHHLSQWVHMQEVKKISVQNISVS